MLSIQKKRRGTVPLLESTGKNREEEELMDRHTTYEEDRHACLFLWDTGSGKTKRKKIPEMAGL